MENTLKSQLELKVKISKQPKAREKRGKAQVTKSWLVLVLHLIVWESGASFLDQSQSVVKLNQLISDNYRHDWKLLYYRESAQNNSWTAKYG